MIFESKDKRIEKAIKMLDNDVSVGKFNDNNESLWIGDKNVCN